MDRRVSQISFRRAVRAVADLVMPRVCVVCGRKLLLCEEHVCTECEADLPRTFFSAQRDNPMALAFNALIEREMQKEGSPSRQPLSYASALLFYRAGSPYSNIPRGLKYGRNFGEGRHFSRMLGRELAASPFCAGLSAVIPVPLHPLRCWRRGYNQAEVIAKGIAEGLAAPRSGPGETDAGAGVEAGSRPGEVSKPEAGSPPEPKKAGAKSEPAVQPEAEAGSPLEAKATRPLDAETARQSKAKIPVLTGILRRVRRTKSQTRLGKEGRYANVKSAFTADAKRLKKALPAGKGPIHLLLVDDVYTTGATLLACERALRTALTEAFGPEKASQTRISIAPLAFAG